MQRYIRELISLLCTVALVASSVSSADSAHVRGGSIPGTGTTDTDASGAPPAGSPDIIDGRTFPNDRYAISKYELSIDQSRAVNLLVTIRGEKLHSVRISKSGVKRLLWYNDFPYVIDDNNHLLGLNLDRLEAFRLKFSWAGVFKEGLKPSIVLSLIAASLAGLKQAAWSTVSHYDVVFEACGAMAVGVFCSQAMIRGLINNYHALGHGDDLFTKKIFKSRFRPYVIGDVNKITYTPTGEVDKLPVQGFLGGLGRDERMMSIAAMVKRPRNGRTCRRYLERYSRF